LIGTLAELKKLNNTECDVYEFEADIDLVGEEWHPLTGTFSKTIDGKGHKIDNFNVNLGTISATQGGIVATLNNGGAIRNLHIASGEVKVTTSTFNAGVFAGTISTNGEIAGCSNAAKVNSTGGYVGGICGYLNSSSGKITGCANYGDINGGTDGRVSGIANCNSGAMTACYNTGAITGGQYTAGISGFVGSSAKISASYNTGQITSTSNDRGPIFARTPSNPVTLENCYYAEGTCDKYLDKAISFSSGNWPKSSESNWGIGDGTIGGNYWKSLGSWNGGSPQYPILYWE
jgi:hypothetical protein